MQKTRENKTREIEKTEKLENVPKASTCMHARNEKKDKRIKMSK